MNLIPSAMSRVPVDSCTPRMTALGVYLPMRAMAPVAPMTSRQTPMRIPEAIICWGLMAVAMA